MKKNFKIQEKDEETRIDRWLKRRFSLLTQSFIENKLRRGLIRVNHKIVKSNYKVLASDVINISGYSEKIYSKIKIKKIKKSIPKRILEKFSNSVIYESTDFIIIDKWIGISVQGVNKFEISIADIICSISDEYSLVHRLDKETTGLLIISKNYKSTKIIGQLFKDHEITKSYIAICQGIPKNKNSIIKLGIKNKNSNKKLQTITKYKVINTSKKICLVLYQPLTGRMHQLRIVSKYLNSPIIGDRKYSFNNEYLKEPLNLNAFYLKFAFKNYQYEFQSRIPIHIIKFMKKINMQIPTKEKLKNLLETF